MKTTVIPALKNAAFYGPFLTGGALIARQVSRVPAITELFSGLESKLVTAFEQLPGVSETVAHAGVDTLELLIGGALAVTTAYLIKRSRKKGDITELAEQAKQASAESQSQVQVTQPETAEEEQQEPGLISKLTHWGVNLGLKTAVAASLAAAIAAPILHSYEFVPQLYSTVMGHIHQGAYQLSDTLGSVLGWTPTKVVGGAALVGAARTVYPMLVSRKHAPIQKRYYIDGWTPCLKYFRPIRYEIQRSAAVLGFKGVRVRAMNSSMEPCATIRSYDFSEGKPKRQEAKWLMNYRADEEPHRTHRPINAEHVEAVLSFIREKRPREAGTGSVLSSENVAEVANESDLYEAARVGHFREMGIRLTPFDVGRIVRALAQARREDLLSADVPQLVAKLNAEKLFNQGGRFNAHIFDARRRPYSLLLTLNENIELTYDTSADPHNGYGPKFDVKGDVVAVLQFRLFGSDGVEQDVNVFREDLKAWNQILVDGLGRSYCFYTNKGTFIYDEWYTGSIPVPFMRDRRVRRIGYVYTYDNDQKGRMVAKVSDDPWKFPMKLWGNVNGFVDVYDQDLAEDDTFGLRLCAFYRYLTYQHKYRANRIQEVPPLSVISGQSTDMRGQT